MPRARRKSIRQQATEQRTLVSRPAIALDVVRRRRDTVLDSFQADLEIRDSPPHHDSRLEVFERQIAARLQIMRHVIYLINLDFDLERFHVSRAGAIDAIQKRFHW